MSDSALKDRVVAFIDILGFKDLVSRLQAEPELFKTILEAQEQALRKEQKIYESVSRRVEMTAFSDCVVLSAEAGNESEVVAKAGYFAIGLLHRRVLCRGAVVTGKAYHRERILFGKAVIDAYEAERDVAKYPRIIIDNAVAKRMIESERDPGRPVRWSRILKRDVDGCWFINLFHTSLADDTAEIQRDEARRMHSFRLFRKTLVKHLAAELKKPRLGVLAKHRWLVTQFNDSIEGKFGGQIASIDFDTPKGVSKARVPTRRKRARQR
jgi:hypothetical protein